MSYPIEKLSFSSFRSFVTSPWLWKNRYILGDKRNASSPAMIVGSMAHMVIELFYKGNDLSECIKTAHGYLDGIPDEEINFWKTGSREDILKNFQKAVSNYFEEMPQYDEVLKIEEFMEACVSDEIDGKKIESAIPFCGKIDLLAKHNGEIFMEDYKFVKSFTDEDEPKYIFQSFFYYYILKALGIDAKYAVFKEVKISKNKDGSSQINNIKVVFEGDVFEENKIFFWYNITAMLTLIKDSDQDTLFLYNIFDTINGKESFQMQKESILGYKVKAEKSENFSIIEERKEKVAKYIDDSKGKTKEDKIVNKLLDFGVSMKFERVDEGYSYDRYVFTPSRGVKMAKIVSMKDEIKQALAVENVRIEAPILGTTFVGVEIPKENRIFLKIDKSEIQSKKIPLGKDISGQEYTIDLQDATTPHLLVVGKTGSGKSEFLRVACRALEGTHNLILIDPKRSELKEFSNGRNHYTNEKDIFEAIQSSYSLMMAKYAIYEKLGIRNIDEAEGEKHTTIVFEEYANIRLGIYGKLVEELLLQIAALGRAVGVHLILSTQRPDTKVVSGNLKANIGARVCFAVASGIDSRVAIDSFGAEDLNGKGDLLFKNPWQNTVRLQSYFLG